MEAYIYEVIHNLGMACSIGSWIFAFAIIWHAVMYFSQTNSFPIKKLPVWLYVLGTIMVLLSILTPTNLKYSRITELVQQNTRQQIQIINLQKQIELYELKEKE